MTGATSGKGTAYPSGAPEFTSSFSGVRVNPIPEQLIDAKLVLSEMKRTQ
jgi:hypothetical protein